MPMLRFRGIGKKELMIKSEKLLDELKELVGCPRDYFSLELINSDFIYDGKEVLAPTFIEVHWFHREQEIQDKVALCLTETFKENREYIEIYFTNLKEKNYYENGTHF